MIKEMLIMTKQQIKAIDELGKIRVSGKVNMMNKNKVLEIANYQGLFNLVDEVVEVKDSRVMVNTKKYLFLLENM
jgi:hypothetical protein